jgi:segregation and condensation protein A
LARFTYDFPVPVTFRIEHFEGPLDLLLQLVEQEKLDISQISLARVADQFVQYVNEQTGIPLEEMADFLLVAAKLVYIKSKLLIPSLHPQEVDEGPDLETQLRQYRAFVQASKFIDAHWAEQRVSFTRAKAIALPKSEKFAPPQAGVTAETFQQLMWRVIARLEPLKRLPQASLERIVTVREKIDQLFSHIRAKAKTSFHEFVGRGINRQEAVASFLALLELVKQRFVVVAQGGNFEDISIEHHPEAPASDPFAESFV